ncbi:RNA-directed DNA polymerase [Jeotgalibacillus sp. JSM ZJ347]|uniref:RNA-directed DNA polymerase n=1 Tax=Jeotgalibacillus sp. JSM ZJ347 TaxID=3342117 RepID=UPI0035A96E2F
MKVSKYKRLIIKNRNIYVAPSSQKLVDYQIHLELKNKYRLIDKNRDYIIDALLTVLSNKNEKIAKGTSLTILRFDVKNFFESINTHKLYQKLNKSMMLKENSLNKVKEIVFSNKVKGLPQGISFSSSLSEIYLEEFDQLMPIILPNIQLYERFVDDIIVVIYGNHKEQKDHLISLVEKLLKNYQLELNDKTQLQVVNKENNFDFSYLGYSFKSSNGSNEIDVSVSNDKIKKYIKKIQELFSRYFHSSRNQSDVYILYYSLRNLLWKVETKKYSTNKIVSYGFKNSYKRINRYESYDLLNKEIAKQINTSRLFSKKNKKLLFSLNLSQAPQIYNYNKATLSQLHLIANNIGIPQPLKITKNKLVMKIFDKLY